MSTSSTTSSSTTTSGTSTSSSTTSSPSLNETELPGTLRVGISFDQPGVGLREADTYSGPDADVARYIARYPGISRITFVEAQTDQRETLLATGRVDLVLAAYSITPERADQITFAGPYLTTGRDLLVPTTSRIRKPSQLSGSTVCSVRGSQSTTELVANYPGLHLTVRPRISDCVDLLKRDKVDAVTSDAAILAGFARASTPRTSGARAASRSPASAGASPCAVRTPPSARTSATPPAAMVEDGEWKRSVRDNPGTVKQIGKRTATPPKLQACPEPRPASTSSSDGSPSSS
uniref:Transporter substrate-binding domain-containing protein n=1 Tax=Janibacter limosus TaxID=53458 RepID=A0AC61U164_9MICO|nr:transporter substrate-binding domain-containing protein [Janibacter limosus]